MKIWEVDKQRVVFKRNTNSYNAVRDELRRVAAINEKIQKVISEEFDDITFWETSLHWADVEEWQCGSIGPKGKICLRCKHHKGKCSDFFSPADAQCFHKQLEEKKKIEFSEILGKKTTSKFNKEKLQSLLEENNVR